MRQGPQDPSSATWRLPDIPREHGHLSGKRCQFRAIVTYPASTRPAVVHEANRVREDQGDQVSGSSVLSCCAPNRRSQRLRTPSPLSGSAKGGLDANAARYKKISTGLALPRQILSRTPSNDGLAAVRRSPSPRVQNPRSAVGLCGRLCKATLIYFTVDCSGGSPAMPSRLMVASSLYRHQFQRFPGIALLFAWSIWAIGSWGCFYMHPSIIAVAVARASNG